MTEKIYISWEEFYSDSKYLCKEIQSMNMNIKGIVCITRGGLVPTAIISSELNIRKIETYGIKTYSDSYQKEDKKEILSMPIEALRDQGKDWIILDELVDTGNTADYMLKQLPLAKLFAVYTKIPNQKSITKYIKEFNKNTWLYFPWEKDQNEV